MKKKRIDIAVPVLNEERTLAENIKKLHGFLREQCTGLDWRIVIADNGSVDATPQIAARLAVEYPEVLPVGVPRKGVGLALKTAWGGSDAEYVGYMDLDLATDLKHFPEAVAALEEGYDLVYGSRLHKNAKVVGRTLKREIVSRIFNRIIRLYLRIHFSDGMCGFKFLRRDLLDRLMDGGAVSDGWFFSTELLTVAEWQGRRLYELPVEWTDDAADSRVRIVSLAMQYIRQMRALKKHRKRNLNK